MNVKKEDSKFTGQVPLFLQQAASAGHLKLPATVGNIRAMDMHWLMMPGLS